MFSFIDITGGTLGLVIGVIVLGVIELIELTLLERRKSNL